MTIQNEISMPSIENSIRTLPIKCEKSELMDQYKSWNELNTHVKCNWANNYVQS